MKAIGVIIAFVSLTACYSSKPGYNDSPSGRFLYKTDLDTSGVWYGSRIELKPNSLFLKKKENEESDFFVEYPDDRDYFYYYPKDDKIAVLNELLTFYGDTTKSNKAFKLEVSRGARLINHVKCFTIEVEALFLFTRFLTIGIPPIRPVPINRKTGEEINCDKQKIKEIYAIYQHWLKDNKTTNFGNMTLPLTGTSYGWIGDDKDLGPYLKKSL